jgi:hypothetical protein
VFFSCVSMVSVFLQIKHLLISSEKNAYFFLKK